MALSRKLMPSSSLLCLVVASFFFFTPLAQSEYSSSLHGKTKIHYTPSSPLYSSLLTKAGVSFFYPQYDPLNTILENQTAVKDVWYDFSLNELHDGLYFQIAPRENASANPEPKPHFTVEIESPDQTIRSIYYDEEFPFFPANAGTYRFRIIDSELSEYNLTLSTLALRLPTSDLIDPKSYLLIEPDFLLNEGRLNQFETFFDNGGHALVISNDVLSNKYGAHFVPFNFGRSNDDQAELAALGINDATSLELIERYSPTPQECTYFRHFSIAKKGDLIQRFYCTRSTDGLYTVTFVGKDFFVNLLNHSDRFDAARTKLAEVLTFPTPYQPAPAPDSTPSSFDSLLGYIVDLQVLAFPILLLLFLYLFLPSKFRHYWNSVSTVIFSWTDLLKPMQRHYFFFGFMLSTILLLYDFFIFQAHNLAIFFLVLFFGMTTFFMLKRKGPVPFSRHEKYGFYVLLFFIVLSPFFSFRSVAKEDTFYSFPAALGSDRRVSLVAENAWLLPEGFLMSSNKNFSLQIAQGSPFKTANLSMALKGNNATLSTQVENRSYNFFLSELDDFSLVKQLPNSIDLYRSRSTSIFNRSLKPTSDWKEFILKYLPKKSSVAAILTSEGVDPLKFLTTDLPFDSKRPRVDLDTTLAFDPTLLFHTYVKDSFDLNLTFDTSPLPMRFILKNEEGNIIAKKIFAPSFQEGATFSLAISGIEKGIYTFYFEPLGATFEPVVKTTTAVMIKHVRLNSPYLVFAAPQINLLGNEIFYSQHVNPSLEYESLIPKQSFSTLGGTIISTNSNASFTDFANIPHDSRTHYQIVFPKYPGEIRADQGALFSLTEGSWFNPSLFSFHSTLDGSMDYAIVEDYPIPLAQPDHWFQASRSFNFRTPQKTLTIPFEFIQDSAGHSTQPHSWILLGNMNLTLD